MFAENKTEYDWLEFLNKKKITFDKITNQYGKITDNFFYLDKSDQAIFICDFLTLEELEELTLLSNKEKFQIVIAYSSGKFNIITDSFNNGKYELKKNAFICKCTECGNWWFGDYSDSYQCKVCGKYDGDRYISNIQLGTDKILYKKEQNNGIKKNV